MRTIFTVLALLFTSVAFAASPVPSDGIISTSGDYYLASDRTSTGMENIQITANNVTLDLKRKTVRCNPANPETAVTFGVKVTGGNVTVRDGKITGCYMGGHASSSPGNVSWERVDFSGNTYIGANGGTAFVGCIFANIAGYDTEAYAIGINAPANGYYIFGSTFRNLHRQPGADPAKVGEGVGVLISSGTTNGTIEASWFENDELGLERDIAIWIASTATGTIRDNTAINFGWAIAAPGTATVTGMLFWMRDAEAGSDAISAGGSSTVSAGGNVIIGYDSAFAGPVTDNGNLILP